VGRRKKEQGIKSRRQSEGKRMELPQEYKKRVVSTKEKNGRKPYMKKRRNRARILEIKWGRGKSLKRHWSAGMFTTTILKQGEIFVVLLLISRKKKKNLCLVRFGQLKRGVGRCTPKNRRGVLIQTT